MNPVHRSLHFTHGMQFCFRACLLAITLGASSLCALGADWKPQTAVTIQGEQFFINDKPTYEGVTWKPSGGGEFKIEGLLMNARLVQGIFDDLNPETRERWAYPDTGKWDPDRNTNEFIDAMTDWRAHGLLGVTVNMQGGSPEGYSREQPWHNSALDEKGGLREAYMDRLARIIRRADDLGMVVVVGIFYFGQDERLEDDEAVKRAVGNTVDWIGSQGFTNVLLEIANECNNNKYERDIIKSDRVHELIELAQKHAAHFPHPLPVSVSYNGGSVPEANVVKVADYLLLHGNGVSDPTRLEKMITTLRGMDEYRPMPIVNNEDDRPWRDSHQGWGDDGNNFAICIRNYASWGFFDFRQRGENFDEGYQSVPINWKISSQRKQDFFNMVKRITGH